MNRRSERILFGCLLVALMVGIFALKVWMMSVEERLADNIAIHRDIVGDDKSRTNVLTMHERRLKRVEGIILHTWAAQAHRALYDWPTQEQIARGRNDE